MFHQIIVLLLIVGSLLQFLSLCRLFSVAHEHRLHAGVVKLMQRVLNAFEDYGPWSASFPKMIKYFVKKIMKDIVIY